MFMNSLGTLLQGKIFKKIKKYNLLDDVFIIIKVALIPESQKAMLSCIIDFMHLH
jgi:hypothetical protein